MNSLRFTSVVGIWLCSLCAGCASPHVKFDRPLTREGAAAEGYETVIRVDQYGNVERGGDARPSDLALPHQVSKESSRRAQPSPTDPPEDAAPFNDLAAALAEQGVDAQRVQALVAAYQRDNQTPQVVTPADNSSSSTPGQAVAQASAAAPLAGVDQPTNILPAGVEPTLVHDRNFTLEFDDQVLGPDGISKVELFMTRDAGRTWQPLGEDPDRKSPFHVSVPGEGVYGFRIAVAGRNGLASRPPKTGDRPELWVRVDAGEPLFRGNLRAAGMQTAASEPAALSSSASAAPTTAPKAQPKANADNPNANADWQAHLAQAIVALEGELASGADGDDKRDDKQTDNNSNHAATSAEEQAQLDARLRLLYVAAGRQEEALRSSRHQSADEHEFWSHQLQALKMMVEPQRNLPPQRQAAAALVELRDAGDRLAAISELQIKNLTFCTGAHSFGSYETSVADGPWQHKDYRDRKFEAEQPVVMYFEVDSFASEQHTSREFPDGAWRTSLRGSYSIVDASGRPVEQRELKLRDDLCQNRRRDYFVAYKMWMPKLNPGHYSLELLVEDALAGKIGASSIDFEIVSR